MYSSSFITRYGFLISSIKGIVLTRMFFQMVDRVWYKWQQENSKNKNAFEGGSISVQVDPTVPITGGPPMLSVRSSPFQPLCARSDRADRFTDEL